jgi:ABC-type multidrug transport system fused ATPase/permease subunit
MSNPLTKLNRLWQRFFRKSRMVNSQQALNVPSLIVLVLVDIFILVNVFFGLNDISSWHLSPEQAYPCYGEWRAYRENSTAGKDYEMLNRTIAENPGNWSSHLSGSSANSQTGTFRQAYDKAGVGRQGKVDQRCLDYAVLKDAIRTPENRKTISEINKQLDRVSKLETDNRKIREQYDSTLLEKVAGQPRNQSINNISADEAKRKQDANSAEIIQRKQEVTELKKALLAQPAAQTYLTQLQNADAFNAIAKGHDHAGFWYPSIQLGLQALFLVPLITIAYAIHRFALRKNYGLVALLSWHLLIIALIPALLKVFEFLQVGAIVQWVSAKVWQIFGGLLFLVSYLQIALIPLAGFALIKLFQRFSRVSSHPQKQAASRISLSQCLNCGKKIRPQDAHCAHCGYQQYRECPTCYAMTHRHMPHCTHCGSEMPIE